MSKESPFLSDLPSGPLDKYRKQASFSWKELITLVDGEENIAIKAKYYNYFMSDPFFKQKEFNSIEEARKITTLRVQRLFTESIFTKEIPNTNPYSILSKTVAMYHYGPSLAIKFALTFGMFRDAILMLGNETHMGVYRACDTGKVFGSFALTEIGHGSNTKGIKTVARFYPPTQEFVLNSTGFEAAKCWSGSASETATHCIVYAQLILPDGTNKGVHAFLIKVRNTRTGLLLPGIIVRDMGKKAGLNELDNGVLIFRKHRIHRNCLLNKTGDVTASGKYISTIKNDAAKSGISLMAISVGRLTVIYIAMAYITKAVPIAVRYAAVREQFGPTENEDVPIIEYQLVINSGPETHALLSSIKPLATWLTRDAIQECREVCGGHGYLTASGLADIRNANDAACTYEGDNNVLLQQTSNWLLRLWSTRNDKKTKPKFYTTLNTVSFLLDGDHILRNKFSASTFDELTNPQTLVKAYKWLICYVADITSRKLSDLTKEEENIFNSRNKSQVFFAKTLSLVYGEFAIIERCYKFALEEASVNLDIQNVLLLLISLYGTWSLEKHLSYLYQGGYITEGPSSSLFKNAIINICAQLKSEAVALADGLAPPDFFLNSVLGNSDGEVYKHLRELFFKDAETFKRPDWLHEVQPLNSKL